MKIIQSHKIRFILLLVLTINLLTNNLNSQVVINEVMFMPGTNYNSTPGSDNTSQTLQSLYNNSNTGAEWVEIYNSSSCESVDISCYILASATAPGSNEGAFRFPQGTIIPPLGFLVIGGKNAPNVDFDLNSYKGTQNLSGFSRWHLDNGCGYITLTNPNGNVVNAVYWSQLAASDLIASNSCGSSFDNNQSIAISTCNSSVINLPQAKDISSIEYTGNYGASSQGANVIGKTLSRTLDGGLTWSLSNAGGTPKACNGVCQIGSASFNINAQITQPTCGNPNGQIVSNPTPTGSYTYSWTHNTGLTSNTASGLNSGSYKLTVSNGSCSKDTTILLSSTIPFNINGTKIQPTCSASDGQISLNPSPVGSYTYSWVHNSVLISNTATGLNSGSYNITVSNGTCSKDTTIVLNTSAPFYVNATIKKVTCALGDGEISLNPSPAGSYTFAWSHNVSLITNVANNLSDGTYTVTVNDGTCAKDTTIILTAPVPLTLTKDSIPNTVCNGSSTPCSYSGPTILINEINASPSLKNGSIFGLGVNGTVSSGGGEWIELYNPNPCDAIDISGYILGSYNSFFVNTFPPVLASNGMGFVIPASTPLVPPNGFAIIRGINSPTPNVNAIDIIMTNSNNNICIGGGLSTSRFWLQDASGFLGLYNSAGAPQDFISWGTPIAGDLNANPCIPTTNSLPVGFTQLSSYNASGKGVNLGAGFTANSGTTYVRMPDGGAWSSSTSSELTSFGNCNDAVNCGNNGGGAGSSCNGIATVTMTSGQAPYTFLWDDDLAQKTATADKLCAGKYNVTVTDALGCVKVVTVEIVDELLEILAVGTNPSCGAKDGTIDVVASPSDTYNYTWSVNTGIANTTTSTASNLDGGIYKVTVSNLSCSKDTTITLISFPAITNVAVTSTDEKCNNSDGTVTIGQITGGTSAFQYNFNNTGNVSTAKFFNLNSGVYPILVTDINNCTFSTQIIINEIAGPSKIEFQSTNSECSSNSGLIEVLSIIGGQIPYSYQINGQPSPNTLFKELGEGVYTITVNDASNCKLDTLITISKLPGAKELHIPNVISPNSDNLNDVWYFKGECLESVDCQIFNRWGSLISEYTDFNGNWDGKSDGTYVTDGVYFYKLKVTFSDGEIKDFKGNITVIY